MKLKRVFEVLFGQGLYTFKYLIKDNLNEKKSIDRKLKSFIKAYNKLEDIVSGNDSVKLGIIIWSNSNSKKLKSKDLNKTIASIERQPVPVIYKVVTENDNIQDEILRLSCNYIGFVSEGDELSDNYTASVLNNININRRKNSDIKILYFDSLFIKGNDSDKSYGNSLNALPDYSPDFLLNYDYIVNCFVISKDLLCGIIEDIDGFNNFFTYQVLLRCMLKINNNEIRHIQSVLLYCYKKCELNSCENESIMKLKKELLENDSQTVLFYQDKIYSHKHILYRPNMLPTVSIIIPSKDNPSLIDKCLGSIYKYTKFTPYEIIIVDNGGSEQNRKEYEKIFAQYSNIEIKYIYKKMDFNFSKMCNIGVQNSSGEYFLFMNDDIEVLNLQFENIYNVDWLGVLAGQAMQPHTGAVGVKLYFPDTKIIQHVGIVNYESGAAHIHSKEYDKITEHTTCHMHTDCNYLAVTGACLIVSREKFDRVGGFNEELAVTFNDVELCMRLYKTGLHNVVRKDIVLYHHESVTRGEDALDNAKFHRHLEEREKLFDMHPDLVKYDPYYSPYLNQNRLDASINTHYYVNQNAKLFDLSEFERLSDLSEYGKIRSAVQRCNFIHIRGYAFKEGDKANAFYRPAIYVKYKNKELVFAAHRLYDPTLGIFLNVSQNVNFATFYTCINTQDIDSDFAASECELAIALLCGNKVYLTNHTAKIFVRK